MGVWRKDVPFSRRVPQVAGGLLALVLVLFLVDVGVQGYWEIRSSRVVEAAEKWQSTVEVELRRDARFRGVQIRLPKRYSPYQIVSLRVSVDGWVLQNHEVAEVEAIVRASSPPAAPSFLVSGCAGDVAMFEDALARQRESAEPPE